jgi:uncharacterized protein YjbI with pentapeptide repeats
VLQDVDTNGKGSLLTFLHGAGLIGTENPAVALTGADLSGVALQNADLRGANLQGVIGISDHELAQRRDIILTKATMPNGQKYEDLPEDKEGRKEDASSP